VTGFFARTDVLPWGRIPRTHMRVARPSFHDELDALLRAGSAGINGVLAAGLRRAYGDTCINDDGAVIDMTGLDHFVSFDRSTGRLVAEAGVSLKAILDLAIPAGWFLPVSPGTKYVTLGGAVANDVHGKNHHRAGTIGRWLQRLDLKQSDGSERSLGPDDTTGAFAATIGGLGLTGVVTRVALQLVPIASSSMEVENIPFENLAEFFALAGESDATHDYTVAWVDCLARGSSLGRGIFTRARHSTDGGLHLHSARGPSIPVDAPGFLLNRLSLSAFNEIYYRFAGRRRLTTVPLNRFFYPLDAIEN
jgi:FAD/FMN-containing dehydrogenase